MRLQVDATRRRTHVRELVATVVAAGLIGVAAWAEPVAQKTTTEASVPVESTAPPGPPQVLTETTTPTLGRDSRGGSPSDEQIAAAIAKLKADPNLGSVRKTRRLHWNSSPESRESPKESKDWLHWFEDALEWFANAARALLWVAGILAAGMLGLFVKRFLDSRGGRAAALRIAIPTHVRDLDIRPESLPDDIGSAALELWERGEHRVCLALLYRGLLSRLTHVHGVPIRDSSTEGDCLQLAAAQLAAVPIAYVVRLIRAWQRAVYGNLDPTEEDVRSLCAGFSAALDRAPEKPPVVELAA